MSSQPAPEEGFASLGLGSRLCETLAALGYEEPTPIQRKTIPRLLDGVDLVGQAATGTGKTAAFALPIVEAIEPGGSTAPVALIVTPTRELAMQVSEAIFTYGGKGDIKVVPIYNSNRSIANFGSSPGSVVVATPGQAIDLFGEVRRARRHPHRCA